MIYGERKDGSALEFIRHSATVFHLTGSRYFGTEKEDSDWDFMVQEGEDVRQELANYGFRELEGGDNGAYVGSPFMTSVWAKENVHVQCVSDLRMKIWVQSQMRYLFAQFKPNKEQAKMLWVVCVRLYRGGMEEMADRMRKQPNAKLGELATGRRY